jgi:hypothetical protein
VDDKPIGDIFERIGVPGTSRAKLSLWGSDMFRVVVGFSIAEDISDEGSELSRDKFRIQGQTNEVAKAPRIQSLRTCAGIKA